MSCAKPIIRFIVTTFASTAQDGCRFHYGHIRSTISGRTLFIQSTGPDLASVVEARAWFIPTDGLSVYSVQVELGRHEWKRSNPTAAVHACQLTSNMLEELEVVRELQI